MEFKRLAAAGLVVFGALGVLDASAAPIAGLFSTGAGFSSGQQDTHYALSKTGGDGPAIGAFGYETSGSGFPFGPWLANTSTSQWLTPLSNAAQTFDAGSNGIYTWALAFDLTGLNASTATFNGRWATDNSGIIRLNGTQLMNPSNGFTSWAMFTSTGGIFNAGMNTLEFVVTNLRQNGGNPTGLRVEFLASDVQAVAVPEPGMLVIFAAGLGLLAFSARRRQHVR